MALPLKSGADLYNNQALRLRLHNLGADPTEVGAGLIYFNTSTGLNTSQKARLYTGSAWKTIAFSEDLDVASNADFLALKERVDLLSGDVDTDNLINNLKDLEEFLKDFDETDKLKSLLDGKLDKTGGTIKKAEEDNAPLFIENVGTSWTGIGFKNKNGILGFLGANDGNPVFIDSSFASHTIAFTDSNVASAQALQTSGGVKFAEFAESTVYIGSETYQNYNTSILGKTVRLYSGNASLGLILNSSGNVTIGASDLAGTSVKLHVAGDIGGVEHLTFVGGWMEIGLVRNSSNAVQDLIIQANGGKSLSINPNGGNVGIGTTNPQAKLEVVYSTGTSGIEITRVSGNDEASIAFNGQDGLRSVVGTWNKALNLWHNGAVGLSISKNLDVHIAGNLIVDGEVSAGGRAEEGGNAGGGGAFHSESIGVGATQTTIAHGLGTDDIVVSIYEKDGVSGRWSLILTDVEIVDANNIIVSFGSATSVEHKVVIMGAVA